MEIVCLDMEGTLTPEIWEKIALNTGIEEFNKTTRDIPDYSELMDFRLRIMEKNNLKLSDIQKASSELDLLPGAMNFLQKIRENFQVAILSDTFHEIAKPLMEKMGYPLLLCHNLEIDNDKVISYKLRHKKAKQQAIKGFSINGI
jgi:phosphoserine/homoserine phosphotransferase